MSGPAKVATAVAGATLLAACSGGSPGGSTPPTPSSSATATRTAVSVTLESWRLPAPVSRLVAVTDGNSIVLAGGLSASNQSSDVAGTLNVDTGAVTATGTIPDPVHDAAGAVIGGQTFVFGGGSAAVGATVQRPGTAGVGRLPQPRADLSAATFDGRTYLIGGYDGTNELSAVLSTSDGRTFTVAGNLLTTVRYTAVAAAANHIWIFGGSHNGKPVRTIQELDPQTGTVSIAGKLPTPLSDATAFAMGSQILVAGGRTPSGVTGNVYAFDPATDAISLVAQLPVPVANAAGAVVADHGYLIGGERASPAGQPTAAVQELSVLQVPVDGGTQATATPASAPLSDAHPFNGRLLIADRGNNRLLLVNAEKQILWTFPNPLAPAPPTGFYFPDDAFFIHHGTGIISNQEGNDTVVEIGFPSGAPLWSYGHPRVAKAAPGYLHEPDDAYLLSNGNVVVADANNCRIVFISPAGKQVGQIGTSGSCVHAPPKSLGYPNGDTPLANGNILISEVYGSWISEYTPGGRLVWTVHLPIGYPSDPQQLGPDRYLVADYSKPGGIYEFTRSGRIVWSYHPASGAAMLNHPSLAEQLPGGYICANDDYRDRVVIIDPRTNQIVWQYGYNNRKGTQPGYLNTPDGFDLLEPDGTTPTHPYTG